MDLMVGSEYIEQQDRLQLRAGYPCLFAYLLGRIAVNV